MLMGVTSRELGVLRVPLIMVPDTTAICEPNGTAVGVAQEALSFCQAGQWSGEVTAVTSALPGGARQDKGVRLPLR